MTEGSRRLEVRALEVVLKGGSPWGFSLKGGAEIRSALTVSKVEPDGKANGLLEAGDILLSINDVHCRSRAEAIQLVKSAFNTLTLTVWR
ncbi:protein Shroom3-like [Lingula anatina]|uniref:Protein Shroom3-like n=1 Tax=Lingula anatina TaxID=7574 RepID=A0A1S3HGQ6_LINAN|nr:protein Shroom3-like [Lingula anatina]|eukprot:XP_013385268.1 protein Shroom3-like [Lingula anatina]